MAEVMDKKIELFQSFRKLNQTLGIHPSQPKLYVFSLPVVLLFISSASYSVFKAQTIAECAQCFSLCVTALYNLIQCATMRWKMENSFGFIEKMEKFIQKRSHNPISKAEYIKLNLKIEKILEIFKFLSTKLTPAGIILPSVAITTVNYFDFDLGDDSFCFSYPLMLPFNWKTPRLEYLILLTFMAAAVLSMSFIILPIMYLIIGTFMLGKSCIQDITKIEFITLSNEMSNGNHTKMNETICNFMQTFSELKEALRAFNDLCYIPFINMFLWALLVISSSLFSLQSQLLLEHVLSSMDLFVLFWSTFVIFIACEYGEILSTEFDTLNDAFCQCDWYLLTAQSRLLFKMIVAHTQQPVIIGGYRKASCMRETFQKIMRMSYTYFMALHQING